MFDSQPSIGMRVDPRDITNKLEGFYTFVRLQKDGSTCASEGLAPINNYDMCETAIAKANALSGKPGSGSLFRVSYSFDPSGCYTSCYNEEKGFHCGRFNSARSEVG